MPTPLDFAYFAGLMDGEGSIHIVLMNREKRYYQTRVVLAMTEVEPLVWAHAMFPGGRLYRELSQRNHKAKPISRIDWTGPCCEPLLRGIYPFLRVKAPQAELLFQMWSLLKQAKHHGNKVRPLDLVQQMTETYEQCKSLNKRGVAA